MGLPIGFAMARLKRCIDTSCNEHHLQWLTDRIRDGAIETSITVAVSLIVPERRLTDRIRDGAIETSLLVTVLP